MEAIVAMKLESLQSTLGYYHIIEHNRYILALTGDPIAMYIDNNISSKLLYIERISRRIFDVAKPRSGIHEVI
jgi:hypothetical protein